MLFNSFSFVFVFFPFVTTLYFLSPHRIRWFVLLLASAYFYIAFVPKFILVLFALIAIDYTTGILIEGAAGARRRNWLMLSLSSNIAILGVFKYFNFVNGNLAQFAETIGWNYPIENLNWLLPIGLSFHTFQSMAYTIEVYRGDQKAERHLGYYALYVMYYPQLVAGPIERPQNLLHQFREPVAFDMNRVGSGLQLIVWGLFKKVFAADRLALIADAVYSNPSTFEGWSVPYIIATYAFAFQIYFDFSGYSDIARGASRVMGIELMENFRFPFIASSVAEFWQRWHISLSTWFKDYLYVPLVYGARDKNGDLRAGRAHVYIVLVFLTSGFWHGAGWNFGLWGACHGLFIVCSTLTKNLRARLHRTIGTSRHKAALALWKTVATFHLIWFTWILFRANTLTQAFSVMTNIGRLRIDLPRVWQHYRGNSDLLLALFAVILVMGIERAQRTGAWDRMQRLRFYFSFPEWFAATLIALIAFGAPVAHRAFIYFQF